ncbi:carbohydrate ABC transporter permease [Butyrivibrio sp. MC2013]|uniref:carbohydrate ABC transporter permease n=1 Tax=Butyrivibrio sp. MC2013 TaxID=1280686 RepID=UPI00040B5DAE|nr:carbohydrate ABC transporter permease [Butyrivibrio sp. MC2013]
MGERLQNKKANEMRNILIRYCLIIVFGIPMVMPVLWMLTTALKDNVAVFKMPPQWIPDSFHFENFTQGLVKVDFWRRFLNTLFVAVLVMIGSIISSLSVGYALSRFRFKGRKVWFYLIIGSMMIPGMVTVMPMFRFWSRIGAYGTWLPMIIPAFLASPFNTFLTRQFLSTVPKSYDEAAKIDGASNLQILSQVIAPLCKPLIAYMAISSFQGAWNDYMTPLLYVISKPEKWTLSLAVARLSAGSYGAEWNLFMAADIVYFLPILVLFFVFQDYFMEGLGSMTASGVK